LNNDGTDGPLQGSATAVVNGAVKKVGVTTGKTAGTIVSITFATNPVGETPKTNQILIKPTSTFNRFSDHGDSGSVVVDQSNNVVGLLYAGWDSGSMLGQTVACPIGAVTTAMGISIISGSFQQSGLAVASAEAGAVQGLSPQEALVELRAIAEALVRSARVDSYILPEAIDGVSRSEFIGSLRTAIEQACGEELRETLSQHADRLAASFCTAHTARAMIGNYCAATAEALTR
jgi:hypothetical protein